MVGQIRAGGGLGESGGELSKILKKGWNRTKGRGQNDFKKGGGEQAGSRSGALKGGGGVARTLL